MKKFSSIDEVLDFAINEESKASTFYQRIADMVKRPKLVIIVNGFARDELKHRTRLEALKAGKLAIEKEEVGNLNIADSVPEIEPHPYMNYAELLIVAMKKEKSAYKLYMNLAALARRKEFRDIFLKLAQEEAGHKLRLEVEYDLITF